MTLLTPEAADTPSKDDTSPLVDEVCLWAVRRLAPDGVVQRCTDGDLTAKELLHRVDRVRTMLREACVRRGDVVSLKSRRDSWLLPVLLGILSSGAAYHVIPFNSPAAVEDSVLDVTHPAAVVVWDDMTPEAWRGADSLPLGDTVRVLRGSAAPAGPTRSEGEVTIRTGEDIAYVCTTSGTTGTPKCTAVPHRAVQAFLDAAPGVITLTSDDIVAARSSAAFDLSVWELFAPLLVGATTVLVPEAVAADTARLHATLGTHKCTVLSTTPSAAYQLGAYDSLEGGGLSLRRLLVGGEAGDGARLRDVLSSPGFAGCQLDNWYGPTETTVSVAGGRLGAERLNELDLTIGPAMPGVGLAVVDELGYPATTGELVVSGAQLAHGYLGDPRATAAAFVPEEGGSRRYRTGDVARIGADGWVTYLGRQDNQVQLRGYRLELSEVERALAAYPAVSWCHAGVGGKDNDVLMAWFSRRDSSMPFDREACLRNLYGRLPRHAVPAALIEVDTPPFGEGQKLATQHLPQPGAADFVAGAMQAVPPQTETEERILRIWQDLLDVDDIGVTHHFFHVGGHSLLAARLLTAIRREFGIRPMLGDVMQNLTIRELGQLVDAEATRTPTDPAR